MRINSAVKTIKLICVIGMIVPLLTGCWDRLEIEERAVVLGISVDTADKSTEQQEDNISHYSGHFPSPNKDMIHVAVQIALPGKIPLGPGESGGGGKGKAAQTVWIIDEVGHTIDDALMNIQQQVSGRLFFGHLRIIVVSAALARKGMSNLNDYFRRDAEVRRMAWMIISEGNAEDLMKTAPELERVPALYLMSTMDNAVKSGKFPENYVGMFWSNSSKKGQEAFLPYLELKKEQNVEIKGMAYFKGEKMSGSTDPFDIAAYMGAKGMNPAGYRGILKLEDTKTVTVYATSRKSRFDARIRDGRVYVKVSVFTEVNLEEKLNERFVVNNSQILKEIEQLNKVGLKKSIEDLIDKMQEKGVDIFGFGEYIRAKKPHYWNTQVKTKEKWQTMFKDIQVEVVVDSRIRRIGMKAK